MQSLSTWISLEILSNTLWKRLCKGNAYSLSEVRLVLRPAQLVTGAKGLIHTPICRKFFGNKTKGRISKRVFQENKARQIFRKTYQGVRNVRFSENLACFVFLKHPFWDSPFCLITDEINTTCFSLKKSEIYNKDLKRENSIHFFKYDVWFDLRFSWNFNTFYNTLLKWI